MLLIICLFVLLIISGFAVYKTFDDYSLASIIYAVTLIFSAIAFVIFGICAAGESITKEATTYELHQTYESLLCQAENNFYDNDNDYGKKELADNIQRWNEKLAAKRVLHDSIWVNWLYQVDYYEFDFIPLEIMKEEKTNES